jgi:palmitoyltransferase
MAAISSPGTPVLHENHSYEEMIKKYGGTYCRKCDSFKPERAHHCKVCNTCTLKMDHHCRKSFY